MIQMVYKGIKTKVKIKHLNEMDTQMGIIAIGYIVYIVLMNWMYIREYMDKGNGVIKRGHEWDNE